tara:strand:+ start:2146 stop:2502 length:357 start_codon:yes stop_codon:yes gene_type:complete
MAIEITEKNNNQLLAREEVTANLSFEAATPKTEDVAKSVADATKSTPEQVVIKKIATNFGSRSAVVTAYVYSSKAKKEEIEPKKKEKKDGAEKKEEAPKKEEAKEAPKEEKKDEEKKE